MSFLQSASSLIKIINLTKGEVLNFPQVKLFTPLKETMDNFNNHEETICNLKILCKIQKGEKLNVKYKFVQQDDIVTKLIRTFYYKDNRINTLTFIRATIKQCFDIITLYKNSDKEHERIISKNILQDLKESRQGIANLKDTYIGDISFSCHLDTLLQEMNARLTEYDGFE